MSAVVLPPHESTGTAWGPVLRTLLVCDLVDSTALVQRLGDQTAAELMRKHDRAARALLTRYGGQEIDKTDGFLVMFERPIQAIGFALNYQRALRQLSEEESIELRARVGIHVGEVILWHNSAADVASGAKRVEVEGLVKPIAARLMVLALPGQILVSGMAYSLAQRAQSELDHDMEALRWRMHGRYDFKGISQSVPVFEVGETELAPFRAPPTGEKARRVLPWWRRPPILALEILALLLAIGVPLYLSTRSQPALAFAARDWVVIGDLRNLTGQTVFDASLDTALRLSIEQSRYVNVVSNLQVRDALKRMQRAVDTPIDRAIGAEIALREGARALILPSIAEVGGRVRVVTEVIDPHTQTTVYANTADGVGMESVIGSVGTVGNELRQRLGEALGAIENDSQPLPKVTTSNLDALRAYALGQNAFINGRKADALSLFEQAIKFDPSFALAYMSKASIHFSSDDRVSAFDDLKHANALREHLSAREALRLDAEMAIYGKPADLLEKWKILTSLYPDAYLGYQWYGESAWLYTNQFDDAIVEVKKAISEHNPFIGQAYYELGFLYLASERYEDAFANLKQAQSLQTQSLGLVLVDAYAVTRQFEQASKVFADRKISGIASNDINRNLTNITLSVDQGQWKDALAAAHRGVVAASAVGPLYGRLYHMTELSLSAISDPGVGYVKQLEPFIDSEIVEMEKKDDLDHEAAVYNVLLGAYLAARSGNSELAHRAILSAEDFARNSSHPKLINMLVISQAALAQSLGKPEQAVELLASHAEGNEVYLTHVVLRDAYAAAGKIKDALYQCDWLAKHRGRAYEESNNHQLLQPFNVAESDLALLHEAEFARKLGDSARASKSLNEFQKIWPYSDQIGFLAPRIKSLSQLH